MEMEMRKSKVICFNSLDLIGYIPLVGFISGTLFICYIHLEGFVSGTLMSFIDLYSFSSISIGYLVDRLYSFRRFCIGYLVYRSYSFSMF